MQEGVRATISKTQEYELKVNSKVNIYHPEEKEILLFDDGIQVKGQKAQRQVRGKDWGDNRQGTVKTKTPSVATDVVLLQKATVGFEYIASIAETFDYSHFQHRFLFSFRQNFLRRTHVY